jgi:hypothetical protein
MLYLNPTERKLLKKKKPMIPGKYEKALDLDGNPIFVISNLKEIKKEKSRRLKVTNLETHAWKLSDTLSKTIEYLYKTDLTETTRRKMIRDILKDNFISFYKQESTSKEMEVKS